MFVHKLETCAMCQFCQCLICKGTASMRCHSAYIRPERSLRAPTSKMCGKACGKTYWHIKLPHIWCFFVEVSLGFRGLSVRTTSTRFCHEVVFQPLRGLSVHSSSTLLEEFATIGRMRHGLGVSLGAWKAHTTFTIRSASTSFLVVGWCWKMLILGFYFIEETKAKFQRIL